MLQTARDANTPYPSDPSNLSKYIRLARITKVYDATTVNAIGSSNDYGCVEIIWLDALDPNNNNDKIRCLTPGASWSRGSGIYRMPHVNDVAAVFQLPNTEPIIIGYLPMYLDKSITTTGESPTEIVGKLPLLNSGEILLKSSGQNEIILTNNNVIKMITRDASNSSIVSTDDIPETTELEFSRVTDTYNNVTAEFTLGASGDILGAGPVVASLEIPNYSQQVFEFKITENAPTIFTLPTSYTNYAYKIATAVYVPGTDNQTSTVVNNKYLNPRDFEVITVSSYTKSSDNDTGDISDSNLSFDGTIYTSYVSINNVKTSSLLKLGGTLVLSVIYRESAGSIKINNLGDCEVNMRNIVFKNKRNVMVGLFDNGTLKTNAAETEVGDTLTGHMRLNAAGVSINSGLSSYATVKSNVTEEDIKNHFTTSGNETSAGKHYFAISDSLPLFYYDTVNKNFGITLQTEYDALDTDIRLHIPYRNFDDGDSNLFTIGAAQKLIAEYEKNNTIFKPYGELRKP